jgi:D-lyxose ketol-isomerase
VTQDDADLVLRYVLALTNFTPEQIRRADVDGKNVVTAVDALLITRYVQGLTNSFGVCKF